MQKRRHLPLDPIQAAERLLAERSHSSYQTRLLGVKPNPAC